MGWWAVSTGRIVMVDELTTAFATDVILFAFLLAVFTYMRSHTLRTLHGRSPLIHTLIMQCPFWGTGGNDLKAINNPIVSTKVKHLRPLIFLPPS